MIKVFRGLAIIALAVFFMTAAAVPLAAQEAAFPKEQVKTIFDFADELGLTASQTKNIRDILNSLLRETKVLRAQLTILDDRLQRLIAADGDLDLIRKKIKEAFDIQATIRITDVEASRMINAVLRPEQLKLWRKLQAAAMGR